MASSGGPQAAPSPPPALPALSHSRLQFLRTVAPPSLVPVIDGLHKGTASAPDATTQPAPEHVLKLRLGNAVADLSNDHPALTRGLLADPDVLTLRDVARTYDNGKLGALLGGKGKQREADADGGPGATVAAAAPAPASPETAAATHPAVLEFQRKVFHREPSAVVARMVDSGEIPVGTAASAPATVPPAAPAAATDGHTPASEPPPPPAPAPAPANLVKDGVLKFFDNNPDFNLRHTSVLTVLSDPTTLDGVPDNAKSDVVSSLKALQTTQALTYTPDALPGLTKLGMTSAQAVAQVPERNFVANFADRLGGESVARDIHVHATNVVIRNDHALTAMLQNTRGSGIAMIDGRETRAQRIENVKLAASQQQEQIDLELIFGPLDVCECESCNSVTSPAAYFVELLQFLRNNNLNPKSPFVDPTTLKGRTTIDGTPLQSLFRRRPDLANLELTCANTNTVLPYIDLANEVMESFIVHLKDYAATSPKQATLEVFNADPNTEGLGGSTPELLAQPQNTNYQAYCILKEAVYPSTKLPFHQPVEAIRLFLEFLGTSRADLGLIFRKTYVPPTVTAPDPPSSATCPPPQEPPRSPENAYDSDEGSSCSSSSEESESVPTPPISDTVVAGTPVSEQDRATLSALHDIALSRSDDAERLLLTEEEYIILTKEAFWVKQHFDIRHGTTTCASLYRQRIGVKQDYEYWGVDYQKNDDMLVQTESLDDSKKTGLTFVKLQFLPRTGLLYSELVDLVKTDFINPYVPKGRDKVIMESFRLSYKFLQSKVLPPAPGCSKTDRFRPLVDFMESPAWRRLLCSFKAPDTIRFFDGDDDDDNGGPKPPQRCRHHHPHPCSCRHRHRLLKWLAKNFEKMGRIVVLESLLDAPRLPFEAVLSQDGRVIGHLRTDGAIYDPKGLRIGRVALDGFVWALGGDSAPEAPWGKKYPKTIALDGEKEIGAINEQSALILAKEEGGVVPWLGLQDDCDIRKDRLRHLDGTSLCLPEFDRMHRFIRLWRKLGWTMVEVDAALSVLGVPLDTTPAPPTTTPPTSPPQANPAPAAGASDDIDWVDFSDSCQDGKCGAKTCKRCAGAASQNPPSTPGYAPGHRHHHRRHSGHSSNSGKPKPKPKPAPDITPAFLHEIVALKKLADLTGLPLLNLLAFWGPISTSGSPSLYSQLFLTHNLRGVDQVFVPDANGNYLAGSPPAKISDHVPILLAAFQLKAADYQGLIGKIKEDLRDDLTVDSVSTIYRYVLLAKVLGVKPEALKTVFATLGIKPFESAGKALQLVELWNKISDAGFKFAQLNYVFTDEDDLLRPVGPSPRSVLQATMTLYTGLNDIDAQHPNIDTEQAATSSAVLASAQLLFSADVAAQIVGFLEGKLIFQTKAPQGLAITIPKEETTLAAKLKYADGTDPTLQVTGQLTQDETAKAKALSANAGWGAAIDRLARRAATFLRTTLSGVFPADAEDATRNALLAGDIADPTLDTSPKKRLYFLQYFLPFLRRKVADKLVIETMAAATSLDPVIALDLLTYIINSGSDGQTSALSALEKIKEDPQPTDAFSGYLIPATTDEYTLVGQLGEHPLEITLDSNVIPLDVHNPDDEPPDLWASKPQRLTGGRLYAIELKGFLPKNFLWKTDRTQLSQVPASALLGNHVTTALTSLFVLLYKCAIIINGFSLTADEVMYFQNHPADFGDPTAGDFDWNKPSLAQWNRLADFAKLKASLPKLGIQLIDLFKWASGPTAASADAKVLGAEVKTYTLWNEDDVANLLGPAHFDLASASNFRNEIKLLKLQKALDVATKIGMGIDLLFLWAQPRIDFWKMHDIAESIRAAIRARYKLSDWEVAIKPTYDELRQLQSNALTAYLINQPTLKEQKAVQIIDADSLFEFFLIDNQMCPCMETSRLKQGTSSVQLFVQRCMLGLEPDVEVDALDRGRWDWMQRYRVWEANRKVFLYPENWIQPSLRDDKSPIYLQLESELHQRDLNTDTVLDAMKNFLFKLEEVANLEVDAIHIEDGTQTKSSKIHIFARTRGAPYKFYYRMYDMEEHTWQPWQDMAVDIPRYEVEKPKKAAGTVGGVATPGPSPTKSGGFYIVPFTFNSRLLVAIPQFQKTQLPAAVPKRKLADLGSNADADESMPDEIWEIKMGLSELRNGKWSPKRVTGEAISETPNFPVPLPPIGSYRFITRKDGSVIRIDAYRLVSPPPSTDPSMVPTTDLEAKPVGRFTFTGTHFGIDRQGALVVAGATMKWSDFHFQGDKTGDKKYKAMYPIQGNMSGLLHELDAGVRYGFDETDKTSMITYDGKKEDFYHSFVDDLLDTVGRTDNIDDLFGYFAANKMGADPNKANAYGASQGPPPVTYNELNRPYSLYNWELGFHAPMTMADRHLQNQQFDLALKMIHYVFNPLADTPNDDKRYWKWQPFHDTDSVSSMEKLFASLRPNTADPVDGQINTWRNHPFQPHVLARHRPSAYMKFVVMKYISILIAYGDYYFRQNTLEMIPMAIQCYVLASHIYGPPAQKIPKRGTKQVQTYNTLLNQWDAFSNAMVQMEVLFPFSINQIPSSIGVTNGAVGLANIFGFASTQYFCVPDNPDLAALRDTIDDRLFKIRHCQDIQGVERKLPLYEPAIDPGLLVAATAAGLSLSSVLNDLNSPLPNYRFKKLLKKALEMCKHLKTLGVALVLAKERKDTEALVALKQGHEGVIQGLVMDQKKLSLDEANKALEGLQHSRKAPEYRMKHNVKLLGEDLGSIPSIGDAESEFKEFVDQIEAPVVESGLKLIASEKEEIEKAVKSLDMKPIINALETAASELHILPTFNAHASPLGVGIASCWGLPNIAQGIQGAAKAYNMVADWLAHQSSNVSRTQSFLKQTQARVKEANSTGYDLKNIDKQILTHQVRIAVHQADITAHENVVTHAQEVADFLTSKYTNTELYTWADQEISNLYYQTYTNAYDLAKKAEMAFRYERGLPDTSSPLPFIKFGYWEPSNSGLLCGERLLLSLKDLEAAYHDSRGHDYEITKHVSLRSINPLALLSLRGDARAEFAIPEILFDMDFPGHYGRRLKSVAVTVRSNTDIPPYTNINCTLRLLSHKFRNTGLVKNKADYPEKTDADDPHFSSTSHVPISSIATSSPVRDAGVFQVDFGDERFLPFEGAGAISSWRLELNEVFRGFDYEAIQDVVVSLQYTSLEGGAAMRDAANAAVADYIKSVADLSEDQGLYAVFDVVRDFPAEWAAVTAAGAARTLTLNALNTHLPVYTKGHAPERIQTGDIWIVTDAALVPGDVSVRQGGTVMSFSAVAGKVGKSEYAMSALHATGGPVAIRDWVVSIGEAITGVKELLILARYSLK